MPPRGKAPGLKRGRHGLPYWIAANVVRDPMGFPDRCIALPPGADEDTLAELCREHSARLLDWIDDLRRARPEDEGLGPMPVYDGTMHSACQVYQRHPRSRFHSVKRNTRKSYTDSLKIIEATVGRRLVRNVTIFDVQHWYDEWRKPTKPGRPERIDRAHDAVGMVKTVLRFNAALRQKDCRQLLEDLDKATSIVRFERGGAREEEMTFAHASAFVRTALEQQARGILPAGRGLAMAIGVAAQFELLVRQKDVIGEWAPTQLDARRPDGIATLAVGDETWSGYFTWENIPGWRWRMKTSKSKYRAAADFDLTRYSLLFPLLDAVPLGERTGAIVKGEHGLPVRERSYRKWFRPIAHAAGIPDEVWSMDARAGGATEAEEAGAHLDAIQGALTHSKAQTTLRYLRKNKAKIASVADARAKKRVEDGGGAP